jgi:hypothetical protein
MGDDEGKSLGIERDEAAQDKTQSQKICAHEIK